MTLLEAFPLSSLFAVRISIGLRPYMYMIRDLLIYH